MKAAEEATAGAFSAARQACSPITPEQGGHEFVLLQGRLLRVMDELRGHSHTLAVLRHRCWGDTQMRRV